MNYSNWCSRAHPGLLILLVDQNSYMSATCDLETGLQRPKIKSFAEYTSFWLNLMLAEIGLSVTMGTYLSRVMKVVIITYGNEIAVSHNSWIDILLSNENISMDSFVREIPDGAGGVLDLHFDLRRCVNPISSGSSKLDDAYLMARNVILSEKLFNTKFVQDSPVPIIINITSEKCIYSKNKLRDIINSINSITFDDGNPIICNCVLSNSQFCVNFPLYEDITNGAPVLKDLYEVSSVIPETYITVLKYWGYPNIQNHARALILNGLRPIIDFSKIQLGGSEPYLLRY